MSNYSSKLTVIEGPTLTLFKNALYEFLGLVVSCNGTEEAIYSAIPYLSSTPLMKMAS